MPLHLLAAHVTCPHVLRTYWNCRILLIWYRLTAASAALLTGSQVECVTYSNPFFLQQVACLTMDESFDDRFQQFFKIFSQQLFQILPPGGCGI